MQPAFQIEMGTQECLSLDLRLVVDVKRGSQRLGIEFCRTERQYSSKAYVRGGIWNTKNGKLEPP